MTSNQIAYLVAKETERSDIAKEEETRRHNKATEDIESNRTSIQDFIAKTDAAYKERDLALREKYNDTYLQIQKSQGDKKLALEEELKDIQKQRNQADIEYQTTIGQAKGEYNRILNLQANETKRHNDAMEGLQLFSAETEAWIKNKSVEYENLYKMGMLQDQVRQTDIKNMLMGLEQTREKHQNEAAIQNYLNGRDANSIREKELQLRERELLNTMGRTDVSNFSDLARVVIGAGALMMGIKFKQPQMSKAYADALKLFR